ncbi:MAG TPA: NAD-dependent epimerase/dehydratase family protein [Gemmatimonadaceae bacterium]|nr:NAD-dependent epimerase/dehydratase family protein [Gemmatimonadaceae bacterium]
MRDVRIRDSVTRKLAGKSILVTGGAGFIGSHLVDRLATENPRQVVVVDNLFLGREENLSEAKQKLGDKLITHWSDAGDEALMRRILVDHKTQVVYDLAVIPLPASLERPLWSVMENTRLTTVLCELLREKLFGTLVHFSSSETYGTAQHVPIDESHPYVPSTPYAAGKLAGDQVALSYAHTFGLDIACLRPFNNYGPRQNDRSFAGIIPIVIDNVLAGEPVVINGDGLQTRDYIYVGDTADAAVRMYEEESVRGKVVNIGSGSELSVNDLVAMILELLGKPDHPVNHGPPRPGDVRRHLAGTERAKELLGFSPQVKLPDGMARTVEWYLQR